MQITIALETYRGNIYLCGIARSALHVSLARPFRKGIILNLQPPFSATYMPNTIIYSYMYIYSLLGIMYDARRHQRRALAHTHYAPKGEIEECKS